MTSLSQTPDAIEPSPAEIHPTTLKFLQDMLPVLREMADAGRTPGTAQILNLVTDEMRKTFPGLDDLTLAAISAYEADKAHKLLHMYGHVSWENELIAAAQVAVEFAWRLATPNGESPNEAS